MRNHVAWVVAIAAVLILWQSPRLRAAGHGPVFGATTPTLGRGGWSVDQAFTVRFGEDGEDQPMLKTMVSFGITENLQVSGSVPLVMSEGRLANARMMSLMSSDREFEGLIGYRFQRRTIGIGGRQESTVYLGGTAPLETRRAGIGVGPSIEVGAATGYASRAHYIWVGGGVQHFADRGGDRIGQSRLGTIVYGYRPPPLRTEAGKPDLRFFVEATAEDRQPNRLGSIDVGGGARTVFVGPTSLLLYKAIGVEGGILFPAHQRVDPGGIKERVRVALNVAYFFWLKWGGVMKLGHIVTALTLGLLLSTSARAELRHVEIRTLGMDWEICAHAVRVAMQKVNGVENVRVSLNDGLTILDLKPANTVKLSDLRQIIKNNGFVSKEARVVVRGSPRELAGETAFETTGTGETFRVAPDPLRPEAFGLLRATSKQTVLEVSGTLERQSPDRERLVVSSVRRWFEAHETRLADLERERRDTLLVARVEEPARTRIRLGDGPGVFTRLALEKDCIIASRDRLHASWRRKAFRAGGIREPIVAPVDVLNHASTSGWEHGLSGEARWSDYRPPFRDSRSTQGWGPK